MKLGAVEVETRPAITGLECVISGEEMRKSLFKSASEPLFQSVYQLFREFSESTVSVATRKARMCAD